jgi:hypothetical protein
MESMIHELKEARANIRALRKGRALGIERAITSNLK